jgi:hypothetical protein
LIRRDVAVVLLLIVQYNGVTHYLTNDIKLILEELKGYETANTSFALNQLAPYSEIVSKLNTYSVTNPELLFEISQILITRTSRVLARLNESADFLLTINDLSKLPKLQRLTDFYEVIYRVADKSAKIKGRLIFSDRVCAPDIHGNPVPISPSTPLHDLEGVSDAIEQGLSLGLDMKNTNGIIAKSFRARKQATILEVKDWLVKYKNYLTNQRPYCFNNATHFNNFITEVGQLFSEFKLGDELFLGGSALFKTLPPDADFVLYFSQSKVNSMLDYYQDLLNTAKEYVRNINRPDLYMREFGYIQKAINESRIIKQYDKVKLKCIFSF